MSSIQPIAKINQHYVFFSHHPKPQSHLSFFFGWLPYHLASFPSYHSSMDQCVYNKVHVSFPPSDLHDEKNRLWQFLRCLLFGTPNKWACPTPLIAGLETLWITPFLIQGVDGQRKALMDTHIHLSHGGTESSTIHSIYFFIHYDNAN